MCLFRLRRRPKPPWLTLSSSFFGEIKCDSLSHHHSIVGLCHHCHTLLLSSNHYYASAPLFICLDSETLGCTTTHPSPSLLTRLYSSSLLFVKPPVDVIDFVQVFSASINTTKDGADETPK
ncbi:hypothetical protein L1887_37697 [Cichorium endivia]|nr:hypothetical protein L1887_37697 [Cichorium endivia]